MEVPESSGIVDFLSVDGRAPSMPMENNRDFSYALAFPCVQAHLDPKGRSVRACVRACVRV